MSADQSRRLVKLLARPVAFHRVFAEVAGGVAAGLFLSQAWYWSNTATAQARDGWFYHSYAEWEDDTCLSRREQYTARKHLRERGLLAEEIRPVPGEGRVTWFRVNVESLCAAIKSLPPHDRSNKSARRVERNRPTPMNGTARPVEQKCPTSLITSETTTEITAETTPSSARARDDAAPVGSAKAAGLPQLTESDYLEFARSRRTIREPDRWAVKYWKLRDADDEVAAYLRSREVETAAPRIAPPDFADVRDAALNILEAQGRARALRFVSDNLAARVISVTQRDELLREVAPGALTVGATV